MLKIPKIKLTYNVEFYLRIISIPLFFLLWYFLYRYLGHYRLPSPIVIVREFFPTITGSAKLAMAGAGREGFLPHVINTLIKTVTGFAIGTILGITVGVAMKWSEPLNSFLSLPIDFLRIMPPLAFVPLLFMIFGRSFFSQIAVIVLYAFLTIIVNTLNAIDNVSPVCQKFAITLGATRGQVYKTIIFPAIIPELIGAARVGIIWAWGYQVIIEMMGAYKGIGKVFLLTKLLNALDLIVIGVVWVIILAGTMDAVLFLGLRYITRWQPRTKEMSI